MKINYDFIERLASYRDERGKILPGSAFSIALLCIEPRRVCQLATITGKGKSAICDVCKDLCRLGILVKHDDNGWITYQTDLTWKPDTGQIPGQMNLTDFNR